MKFRIFIVLCTAVILTAVYYFIWKEHSKAVIIPFEFMAEGDKDNPHARDKWELMRLADPATGKIPENIRAKELAFAQSLPKDIDFIFSQNKSSTLNWTHRGPWNVGGRTRALAIDAGNENVIFAGSVSGGLWRSADAGSTWAKITTPAQNFGTTSIVQDKRPGKTNTWYFSTGEPVGTSASGEGSGSFYMGNGVYKSIDNGFTWELLPVTSSGRPQSFSSMWNLIWNMAVDPVSNDSDVVYAATMANIYRSKDGGVTWKSTLGGIQNTAYSYYVDVSITTAGVLFATLSSDGPRGGVWRSVNGINWTNISPAFMPASYNRMVIGVAPSNENVVYFLGETPGAGQRTTNFMGTAEWNSLWKYTYISGDGTGSGGNWQNLSANLPADGSQFGQFNSQGCYDLLVRVKPDDPNVVFIGGTNLFRSSDGFTTNNNTTQIGGYGVGTVMPYFQVYPEQHPDQHNLVFLPSNPAKMISSTDGGLHKTNDNMASSVTWTTLNNGYLTTQFYTIGIDHGTPGNDIVFGGTQDNGTYLTASASPSAIWTMPSTGDGAHCAVDNGHQNYYFSRQSGKTIKATLDAGGNVTGFRRIDPIGGHGYLFINPFKLDPVNNNVMYLAGGKTLWRNSNLSVIPLTNSFDSIASNWMPLNDSNMIASKITAIGVSENPAHVIYIGTSQRKVFKISDADTCTVCSMIDITPTYFPAAYISCIAVDPRDADKAMVVFSNYNIYSLYYTRDGGVTWEKAGGNIEQYPNGSGNGPSCRWVSIMPVGNKTAYWLASSTGLYATDTLKKDSTKWVQMAYESIGSTVTDMVDVRLSDGLVVAATHGNGVFSTYVTDIGMISGTDNFMNVIKNTDLQVFPNPFEDQTQISITLPSEMIAEVSVYDINGMLINRLGCGSMKKGIHLYSWNGRSLHGATLQSGTYFISLKTKEKTLVKKVVLLK